MTAAGRCVSSAATSRRLSTRSPSISGPQRTASRYPRDKLSKTTGWYPARARCLHAWLPTYPAPPVTKIERAMRVAHSLVLLPNNVLCQVSLPARASLRTEQRNKQAALAFCAAIGLWICRRGDADCDHRDGVCRSGVGGVFFGVWG